MRTRTARPADLPLLADIERAAGELFRAVGMPEIADDDPFTVAELEAFPEAWVAVDDADVPVGYLVAEPVDGCRHIEQVSVDPRYARRGIGRQLIDRLAGAPLTLTTFSQVPWNAPYYLRCGFRPLTEDELTPGLRAIRQREAEHGLDRWPRVCMRREP